MTLPMPHHLMPNGLPTPMITQTVREQVTQDWVDDNRRKITDQYFANLLAQYNVVIEGQSADEQIEVEAAPGS